MHHASVITEFFYVIVKNSLTFVGLTSAQTIKVQYILKPCAMIWKTPNYIQSH